jgi:hypothetical protein
VSTATAALLQNQHTISDNAMTTRDQFAKAAMQAILSAASTRLSWPEPNAGAAADLARAAYDFADAMCAEKKRRDKAFCEDPAPQPEQTTSNL